MSNRIVLISDDSDFFDFIKMKMELRKSDEILTCSFDDIPDRLDIIKGNVLVVNSENSQQKTLDLLGIFDSGTPIIVTAYNDDEAFKKKCYRAGMLDYIEILTSDAEFRARMLPALNISSILEKNKQYRNILVKNKIMSKNNEVFIKYENVIDNALTDIKTKNLKAVFASISPDERNKFLINPNSIETLILNNIRKNDILMNYAPNKYYLIMYNTDVEAAQKHWKKVISKSQNRIYAGFVTITNQTKQQLINLANTNLNEAIGLDRITINKDLSEKNNYSNFKLYRKELEHNLETIITPVLYRIQQKYMNRLSGVKIEQYYNKGMGAFNILGKHFDAYFKINCPGFTKINIDIILKKELENEDFKRISFNPNEFDESILEDLLEQFISEAKSYGV